MSKKGGLIKFGPNDIFHNVIKTYPQNEFFVYDSKIFYNHRSQQSGNFTGSIPSVPPGHISLHELNIDRNPSNVNSKLIYPFVYKNSSLDSFRAVTVDSFFSTYAYGEKISGSYPMSASIVRKHFASGMSSSTEVTGAALKNTFNYYKNLSPHYEYSSSLLGHNKETQMSTLVSIPSIFYGSSIKKGTVELNYYITGTLVGKLQDKNRNGELIQTGPAGSNGSGNVAGVVLYNEGFLNITGAWDLYASAGTKTTLDYNNSVTNVDSSWVYFGVGANDGIPQSTHGADSRASASYELKFSGTNYIPTVTMLAHAPVGMLNHSNNLTYLTYNQTAALTPETGTYRYIEKDLTIKNIVSSAYADPTGSFVKTTYISKIGIYDENKNLIGVANLSKPVKKTPDRDFTFKLKVDF